MLCMELKIKMGVDENFVNLQLNHFRLINIEFNLLSYDDEEFRFVCENKEHQ